MKKLNTLILDSQEAKKPKIVERIATKLHEIDLKAGENLQNVAQKSLNTEKAFALASKNKFQSLKTWYLSLNQTKKVLYALLIVPALIILFLLNLFLFPLIGSLLPLIFIGLNFIFIALKLVIFIIYISYKITKTLMGIYYSISRTISSMKENKIRQKMIKEPLVYRDHQSIINLELNHAQNYALTVSPEIADIQYQSSWKKLDMDLKLSDGFYEQLSQFNGMDIEELKQKLPSLKINILFSYLRFFLLGQFNLYRGLWRCKKELCTIWRDSSKEILKKELALTTESIFTPYAIGAYESSQRLLLTGDFKLEGISMALIGEKENTQIKLMLVGFIPWQSWHFGMKYPFAQSTQYYMKWDVELVVDVNQLDRGGDVMRVIGGE